MARSHTVWITDLELKLNPRVVVWPAGEWSGGDIADLPYLVSLENCTEGMRSRLPTARVAGDRTFSSMSAEESGRVLAGDPDPADPCVCVARTVRNFRRDSFVLRARAFALAMGPRSLLMGIINVTPDSFSDGGRFFDPRSAVEHGLRLVSEGADILDVGGLSTRPGAEEIPVEEEVRRVVPVIEALVGKVEVPISIDTYRLEVAQEALAAGAAIINDITGLHAQPALAELAAEHEAAIVLMHTLGSPRTMQQNPQYRDLMGEVTLYLREGMKTAAEAGIGTDRLVVDPGFGFGKRPEHNLELLRRVAEFRSLGRPVMVGTSRKSTIGKILDRPVTQRVWGTAATVAAARVAGALMFRVHDVAEIDQVRRMTDAIFGG